MTSINTLYSGGYYQLPGQSSAEDATKDGKKPSLADVLSGVTNKEESSYTLNLSEEAQRIINQYNSSKNKSAVTDESYELNDAQKKTLDDIIAKYKDEPFTQETFNKIQNDLKTERIGADTLSLLDRIKNFNPIAVLVAALNGSSYDPGQQGDSEAEQSAKADNYMKMVFDKWSAISTTKPAEDEEA